MTVGYWSRQEELRTANSIVSNSTDESVIHIKDSMFESEYYVYIGGSIIAALFVIAIIRSIFFYTITVGASRNLHKKSFDGVVSTKMR